MALSKRRRFKILHRDNFTCQYCGLRSTEGRLEVDHMVSVYNGGTDNESNLVTTCFDCNRGKSEQSVGLIPKIEPRIRLTAQEEGEDERFMRMDTSYKLYRNPAYEQRVLTAVQHADDKSFDIYILSKGRRAVTELISDVYEANSDFDNWFEDTFIDNERRP